MNNAIQIFNYLEIGQLPRESKNALFIRETDFISAMKSAQEEIDQHMRDTVRAEYELAKLQVEFDEYRMRVEG